MKSPIAAPAMALALDAASRSTRAEEKQVCREQT